MTDIIWPLQAVEPRDVQLAALRAGYGRPGYAYFLRQRLGKTWLALAEYRLLKENNLVDWMIVICPNSIKQAWQDAVEEVDPYIPIHIYSSQKKKNTNYWFQKNRYGGIFIINYESVRSFYDDQGYDKFNTLRAYLVADESAKLADPDARMTKACLMFSSLCQYTRVMSGKPSKGSNNDLWAQLKFISATGRNFFQHKNEFSEQYSWQSRPKDKNTLKLKIEMDPHCFIASDKYLKGFKKIYEAPEQVVMLGEQLRMYRQMEKDLIAEINSDMKMTAPIMLTKYLRLQQISSGIGSAVQNDPNLAQFTSEVYHVNLMPPSENPRIKALKKILKTIGDMDTNAPDDAKQAELFKLSTKVIIICRFKLSMTNLVEELTREGYKVAVMHGGMGTELDAQKEYFHKGDAEILVAQSQVLSFGHTLCGPDDRPCVDIIHYEVTWSLSDRAQCESRPEKMGREDPIHCHDFWASQMDKTMINALVRKEDAAMALMGYSRSLGTLHRQEENDNAQLANEAVNDALSIFGSE